MSVLNSISFVTGPLGCGKSYFAMKHVIEYLAAGKIVATNFDLTGGWWMVARHYGAKSKRLSGRAAYDWSTECMERAYRFDVQDDLYDFDLPGSGEDRGLLVLDEAGLNMNSRLYQLRQKKDKDLHNNPIKSLEFYINMRKRGWTCLVLAHSSEHVDNQVQSMGGGIIKLRNFARVKVPVVGISLAKNPRFLARYFTPDISSTIPEYRQIYGLDKRIADCYQSMQTFDFQPESLGLRLQREGWILTPPNDGCDIEALRAAWRGATPRERRSPAPAEAQPPTFRRLRRAMLKVLSPRTRPA